MTPVLAANIGTLVSALIVLSVIYREFQERVVAVRTVWIRPLVLYLLGGIAAGAVVGLVLTRLTTIVAGDDPQTLRIRGSRATIAIWVALLAGRLLVRFALPAQAPIVGLYLNVAAIALVATAFGVLALVFRRAVAARPAPYAGADCAPRTSLPGSAPVATPSR